MKKVLIDTNVITYLTSPDRRELIALRRFYQRILNTHGSSTLCHTSPVTVSEIKYQGWFDHLDLGFRNRIISLLNLLPMFDITDGVGNVFADLARPKGAVGLPEENDQWQAAICVYYGAGLATADKQLIGLAASVSGLDVLSHY